MRRLQPIDVAWQPDKTSAIPVYEQIVQFIREKAVSQAWPVGTRLPSQRALAEVFQVNRSTVVTALEKLQSLGIVTSQGSGGTIIAGTMWSLVLPTKDAWGTYLTSGSFKANKQIVQDINRLEFTPAIVRLGTGELDPRLFPKEMMEKALESVQHRLQALGYPEPQGHLALREAIAGHMKTLGITVSPASILITSGALQALQLIAVSLVEGGSVIYTEAPTYVQSLHVFQSTGLRLQGLAMDAEGVQYWQMKKRTTATVPAVLYTIPTNHNPTGITMSATRRNGLLAYCKERQIPIIEDGAYEDLYFDGPKPVPLKGLDREGLVIYLGSASKALAPGLRIGWLIAPEPIVQRLSDVKMQVDYGASLLSQLVLAEFLRTGMYDQYTETLRQTLRCRRDAALDVLQRYYRSFATWHVPHGGFYIWLTLEKNVSMERLFSLAAQAGILINPGDIYDFKQNHSLRLSYAYTTPEEFAQAAKILAALILRM